MMPSTHRSTHHVFRPRAFRIVMALCFGLSALSGSFHYVMAHGVAHVHPPCDASPGSCLDTDCNDTAHDTPDTDCVVCVSLARSLGTHTATTTPQNTISPPSPDGLVIPPAPNRAFRPAAPRAPPTPV